MKQVTTKDNSVTFFNENYEETYHSISGALQEAFEKYVKPCKIKDGMKILDICFGLGYNSLAAIHSADNLKIIALENDPKILDMTNEIEIRTDLKKDFEKIKRLCKDLHYKDDKCEMTLLLGDGRKTIKEIDDKFDTVFLDPFSPKKCPELWTLEFFKDIVKLMKKPSILATYSCARIIRDNLKSCGLEVKDGPYVGRYAPSTLACLK